MKRALTFAACLGIFLHHGAASAKVCDYGDSPTQVLGIEKVGEEQAMGHFRLLNSGHRVLRVYGFKEATGLTISYPSILLEVKGSVGDWHSADLGHAPGFFLNGSDHLSIPPNGQGDFIVRLGPPVGFAIHDPSWEEPLQFRIRVRATRDPCQFTSTAFPIFWFKSPAFTKVHVE